MVATIGAGEFIATATAGKLATYTPMEFTTTTVTGSVAEGLDYVNHPSFNAVVAGATEITMPGTYSLSSENGDGAITVGKAGGLEEMNATVNLSAYLTGVSITEAENA
jgi:hypothetical protein